MIRSLFGCRLQDYQKINFYSKRGLLWIALFTFCLGAYFIHDGIYNHDNWGERGTYGDFIGGTAGIFLEILTIITILYVQVETNANNREILKGTNRQGDLQFLSFYLQEIKSLSEKAFPELKTQIEDPLRELEWLYYSLLEPPGCNKNVDRLSKLFRYSGPFGESFAQNRPKRMNIKSLLTGLGDLISWDRSSERTMFEGLYHSNYGSPIEAVVPQESIFMLIFLWYSSLPKSNKDKSENTWQNFKTRYMGEELCYEIDIKLAQSILKRGASKNNDLSILFTKSALNTLEITAVFREDPLDELSREIYTGSLEHTLQKDIRECSYYFSQSILHLFTLNSRIGFFRSIEKYCLRSNQKLQAEHLQYFFGGLWQRLTKLVIFDEKLAILEKREFPPEKILVSSFAPIIRESLISIKMGVLKILEHNKAEWLQSGGILYRDHEASYLKLRTPYVYVTALILSDLISSLDAADYEFFHSTSQKDYPILQKPLNTDSDYMNKTLSEQYQDYLQKSIIPSLNEKLLNEIDPLLSKLDKRHTFLKEKYIYPYSV